MTSSAGTKAARAVRRAAVRATLAASVHNTQPWRFVLADTSLDVHADWNRRLRVLDPRGRQLLISCGCAVFNARVAFAAAGYQAVIERFPDPAQPSLLARFSLHDSMVGCDVISVLDRVIELRATNRRRFADEPVPGDVVSDLIRVAEDEGAELFAISSIEHRLAVARLSQQADQLENADPAYRAELQAWTNGDPRRLDGVPTMDVAPVDEVGDELPGRHFDTRGVSLLLAETGAEVNQCLLLLGTRQDTPAAWLQAGEALERVLLETARHGYAANPITQIIEVVTTNVLLRSELQLAMHPQVLLRLGRAPATPASRRRRLVDVFEQARA